MKYDFFLWNGLKSNQKAIGYPHYSHALVEGWFVACSSQNSEQMSLPETCVAASSTLEA